MGDIVNSASSQEQMEFICWLEEEYPDWFEKVEKEYWEQMEQ